MIIKEVIVSNYQCYYGEKKFEFTRGSNIILGKNGGGKTKFYEALEWLFTPNNTGLDELISKRKLIEAGMGSAFKVGVEVTFQQEEFLNTVKKYFSVQKKEGKEFILTNVTYEGIVESDNGERDIVDGQLL